MKKQKFTNGVCDFYSQFFNNGEHTICFLNQEGEPSLIRHDLSITQKELWFGKSVANNILQFYQTAKDYDYIVFHSLFYRYWLRAFVACCWKLLKKVVWIEWGADLYTWKDNHGGIMSQLMNRIDHQLRTKCAAVVCIFPPDQQHYRNEFPNSQAKVFYAPYSAGKVSAEYQNYTPDSRLQQSKASGEPIYIQVGHSATPTIDHIHTLDTLSRFSDQNIRLFLPLNYGDSQYADRVQAHAEKLFPGKVICLRQMLAPADYFAHLARVDIGIFDTHRQIALGNIQRMLFRNVKLYLPELKYCGDNGAMIGCQGYYEYLAGKRADLDLNAYATRDISLG
jgi:hypothetical protein